VIVVDASALAKYLLRESGWRRVEDYLRGDAYTLDHVVKEVANAIWKHAVLRHAISVELALELYHALRSLASDVLVVEDQDRYLDKAFSIAVDEKVTVYDALYIAQALDKGSLLTADEKQARVARRLGVEMVTV